jgi:hypothetical protein
MYSIKAPNEIPYMKTYTAQKLKQKNAKIKESLSGLPCSGREQWARREYWLFANGFAIV